MAERAQRDIDEARAQRRELFGRQPATGQCPRPVALAKHVALAHQTLQRVEVLRLTQIEPRRQFAMAGIVFLIIARRDLRGGDLQHVRTVLGQGARAGRIGEHGGQVEDGMPDRAAHRAAYPRRVCHAADVTESA